MRRKTKLHRPREIGAFGKDHAELIKLRNGSHELGLILPVFTEIRYVVGKIYSYNEILEYIQYEKCTNALQYWLGYFSQVVMKSGDAPNVKESKKLKSKLSMSSRSTGISDPLPR